MPRLLLAVLMLAPITAHAEDEEREREEAALEADMEAARARIKELKVRKRDEAKAWAERRRQQQALQPTEWPQSQPVTVNVEPCPVCAQCQTQETCAVPTLKKKSTFFAEPKIGWSMLNHRSAGHASLLLGGLVRERVELALSLNLLYARGAGGAGADAGLAYGGLDVNALIVNTRFIRVGAGALLGGGAYVYARDGGLEYGSIFTAAPHANVEFRPLRWLAVGVDGGYRFAVGARSASMDFKALSGPVVSAYLRFGL